MAKIIAEVGSNHLGDIDLIISYAEEAKEAGVDILKFQGWRADTLNGDYSKDDIEYYKKCAIGYHETVNICNNVGIQPLITAFDVENIGQIALAMGYSPKKIVKIASPDMLSWGLLDKAYQLFDEVIISTGMHSTKEIFQLGTYLRTAGVQHRTTLLHCISKYPAELKYVNMARVEHLKGMGFKWGYSDHTNGVHAAIMACAMGAEYVEKHVTLSKKLRSRDAFMSGTFNEFAEISKWNLHFDIIRGERSMYELDKNDYAMREKYCGKWGSNL